MRLVEFLDKTSPDHLMEAAKDRYMQMLPDTTIQKFFVVPPDPNVILGTSPEEIKNTWGVEVTWAVQNLQRADRITWYLRYIKVTMLRTMADVMIHSVMMARGQLESGDPNLQGYEEAYRRMEGYVKKELDKLANKSHEETANVTEKAKEAASNAREEYDEALTSLNRSATPQTRSRFSNAEEKSERASKMVQALMKGFEMGNSKEMVSNVYTDPRHQNSMSNNKEWLLHWMGIPAQKIQNYNWGFMFPRSLFGMFGVWEEEWAEKQKRNIPEDDPSMDKAEKIIVFPDGKAWFNLHKSYCDREGAAMGHCGNSYRKNSPLEIITLREPVVDDQGNSTWQVDLTFVWNYEDGMIVESKGFKNQKPDKKYHPYIIELLKQPWVKGLNQSGSHAPEENFNLNDLDDEKRDELRRYNPRLDGFIDEAEWIDGHSKRLIEYPDGSVWFARDENEDRYTDHHEFELGTSLQAESGMFWKPKLLVRVLRGDGAVAWMGDEEANKKTEDQEDIRKLGDLLIAVPEIKKISSMTVNNRSNVLSDFDEQTQEKILKKKPELAGAWQNEKIEDMSNSWMAKKNYEDGSRLMKIDEIRGSGFYVFKPIQDDNGETFWMKDLGVRITADGDVAAFASYDPFAEGKVRQTTEQDWVKFTDILMDDDIVIFRPDELLLKNSLTKTSIPSSVRDVFRQNKPSLMSFKTWYKKEGPSKKLLLALARRIKDAQVNNLWCCQSQNYIGNNYKDGWFINYSTNVYEFIRDHVPGGQLNPLYDIAKKLYDGKEITPEEDNRLKTYLNSLPRRKVIYNAEETGREIPYIQARYTETEADDPNALKIDFMSVGFWIKAEEVMAAADGPVGNSYSPNYSLLSIAGGEAE